MKGPFKIIASGLLVIAGMLLTPGCSNSGQSEKTSNINGQSFNENCEKPAGVSGSPKTIEEAVSLINSLPKPLTVSCFIASLDRPLKASLTNNAVSGQPAAGTRSPRILIVIDKLTIAVVPDGAGQDLVEFSYMVSATMSTKAELEFPILDTVSARAPYDRVRYNTGTSCGICHGIESRYTEIGFAEVFYSKAFQPQKSSLVNIETFRAEVAKCNPAAEPKRCAIISAFFGKGPVQNYEFPAVIPFFF